MEMTTRSAMGVAGLCAVAALLLVVPTVAAQNTGIASEVLQPGESFTHTFDEPGRFDYHCHVHKPMEAAVVVEAAGDEPQDRAVSIQGGASGSFEPETLTIAAGDTVTWTNDGSAPHQVWGAFQAEGEGNGGHGHDHGPHNDTPSVGGVALLALLGMVALWVRRN